MFIAYWLMAGYLTATLFGNAVDKMDRGERRIDHRSV